MEFLKNKPAIIVLSIIAVIISANAEKSDTTEIPSNITPESVIEDLRNSTTPASKGQSRVKRQFGGYGYPGYPNPYYGRRRILPYPPIIFGGLGFGGPGFGRGFGGRGFGGRGFGGRGGGFGGRGGGIGGRGGGIGGGRGGGGGRG